MAQDMRFMRESPFWYFPRSLAFPGRTSNETIVDTFLANAIKLTNKKAVDPLGTMEIHAIVSHR